MRKIILFGFLLISFYSCVDYLEPYPNADRDGDKLWKYATNIQGLVGQAYEYVNTTRNYSDNEGIFLDGATDNAVITSTTHSMRRLAVNTLTIGMDPFLTYWNRDYQGIYLVNLFLKDYHGLNTRFLVNNHFNDILRKRLHGEAYALRAWFYWDLLMKFGGRGGGNLLGVPIILEPSDVTMENNLARNTYDECVAQIIKDCDSAYKYLPLAHRDFLVTDPNDLSYLGGKNWGRFDGISTRAIKAMVYLTWASPRFNPTNDKSRWDLAAKNAFEVINFKLTRDNVTNGFNPVNGVTWTDPNSPEIIMTTRYYNNNSDIERILHPGGFQGYGEIGPTQELVDAFPMANGLPITNPASGYNPANPYANRDPRLYATVFYNTAQLRQNNTGTVWYTFENWSNGGKDAAGRISTNTRTNYYVKKFIYMGFLPSAASPTRQPHSKFIIRWAQMLLTFAEAANHSVGPIDNSTYGMSARTAIQYLRARKTDFNFYNGLGTAVPGAPDSYLSSVASQGEVAFDALVKNERRIELAFEGVRFFDLRRWTTDADWASVINQPVHGAGIVRNADNSFTYDLKNTIVEERLFTSPYLPIPYSEILRMSNLVQNEGWESWN